MEPILEVAGLCLSFVQEKQGTSPPVIRDLTLAVQPGQVMAVVGSSGSGKSLLAHGILGILPKNARMEGSLRFCGSPLTPRRQEQLRGRDIALVPQGVTYLDPLMKVGPQLRKGRRDRESCRQCRQVLARYGLGPEVEALYPFALSGGMTRRVLISTAVLEGARLIVADEPTPGLDGRAAARILGHFRELADQGAGVLFITHDLDLALTVADRVAVLYAGETVEEAAAADFPAGRLRHPYTKALWDALPQNGFSPLPGEQPTPDARPAGCQFAPRCPRCREACREAVPYQVLRGGYVRCLNPEEGVGP